MAIDGKTLRFCYDRLASLMKTLEISASDDFGALHMVADFATLVGTYTKGFAIITEPYDDRMPSVRWWWFGVWWGSSLRGCGFVSGDSEVAGGDRCCMRSPHASLNLPLRHPAWRAPPGPS